jgi:putative cardiolipin synthase
MGSVLSLTWAPAQLYFDPPAKVAAQDNRRSVPLIFQARPWQWNAQRELVLMTPYFVPQRRGLRLLSRLRRCGVSIRVITNSLASTDVWAAHSGYGPYRKALLHMGVEIFELKATAFRRRRRRRPWFWRDAPVRLHAKTTVVDGRWVLIGSANQDPRSNRLNTEIAVLVDSRNLARQVTAVIADAANPKNSYRLALRRSASGHEQLVWHTMENGRPTVYRQEPGAGVLRRIGAALCRLLPIEDQL